MPNWQPNWADVQFDYQAAYEAISTCYGCIAFLESRHQALDPAKERATREWRGRHRDEFDADALRLERVADDVVNQLHASVRVIQGDVWAAQTEQRFRESDRVRWAAEVREEQAREEQARRQSMSSTAAPTVNRDGVIVLS